MIPRGLNLFKSVRGKLGTTSLDEIPERLNFVNRCVQLEISCLSTYPYPSNDDNGGKITFVSRRISSRSSSKAPFFSLLMMSIKFLKYRSSRSAHYRLMFDGQKQILIENKGRYDSFYEANMTSSKINKRRAKWILNRT